MEIDEAIDGDLIAQLGFLSLGSRFRRLGERLQTGVSELAGLEGIALNPAQFPILVALEQGPRTVGALARRLDLSQPGITRGIGKLVTEGLVEPVESDGDQRLSTFALSAAGQDLLARIRKRIFPLVQRAVAELCEGPADDLLGHLTRLDHALAKTPFEQRLRAMRNQGSGA
ncbi:MarR family winged helix-turn-helix transcriptional regulator [Novosphingobium pentaromativorans]|uniref:MarR family transcriptional regulator n=1 Tax=Novosphingobium pentaromativorans US6-1 TaxID=1088721 RepID=G6E8Y2_9SPHN|nr:MarR family transcriptional regulator [Novosphingobium pentaromativorans]AIT81191.1 MarR family transcriptional regulator [Novosphingobium pentaromativorans US6-1]EHJ62206.1 MarR family transcriptional regulator [Novosphingobium pentaromativorans US6-1]